MTEKWIKTEDGLPPVGEAVRCKLIVPSGQCDAVFTTVKIKEGLLVNTFLDSKGIDIGLFFGVSAWKTIEKSTAQGKEK